MNDFKTDTISFDDDASNTKSGTELTYSHIVMEHIQAISRLSCKDWYGGYWMDNGEISIYRESSREAYTNAVLGLFDLVDHALDEETKGKIKDYFEKYKATDYDINEKINNHGGKLPPALLDHYLDTLAHHRRELFRILLSSLNKIKFFNADMALGEKQNE